MEDLGQDEITRLITEAAARHGLDPRVAIALARVESGLRHVDEFGRLVVSSAGAVGLFQLMPETARELGVDPRDLRQNIEGGIRYFAQLYRQTGDLALAAAAYNAGLGAVRKYGGIPPFEETRRHVSTFLQYLQEQGVDTEAARRALLGRGEISPRDLGLRLVTGFTGGPEALKLIEEMARQITQEWLAAGQIIKEDLESYLVTDPLGRAVGRIADVHPEAFRLAQQQYRYLLELPDVIDASRLSPQALGMLPALAWSITQRLLAQGLGRPEDIRTYALVDASGQVIASFQALAEAVRIAQRQLERLAGPPTLLALGYGGLAALPGLQTLARDISRRWLEAGLVLEEDFKAYLATDPLGRAVGEVFLAHPEALQLAQRLLEPVIKPPEIVRVGKAGGLTFADVDRALELADRYARMLVGIHPGFAENVTRTVFLDPLTGAIKEWVGPAEALRLAMEELNDTIRRGLEGRYNIPEGYAVPTPWWYYGVYGGREVGPVNYPEFFRGTPMVAGPLDQTVNYGELLASITDQATSLQSIAGASTVMVGLLQQILAVLLEIAGAPSETVPTNTVATGQLANSPLVNYSFRR
jgi:hypothetical protein